MCIRDRSLPVQRLYGPDEGHQKVSGEGRRGEMKMEMHAVNSPVVKVDARALVTGKPVYTDDLAPKDSLIVKVLRSRCV